MHFIPNLIPELILGVIMQLYVRPLNNVSSVNDFEDDCRQIEATEGDSLTVYIQLIDKSVNKYNSPVGRRYCPTPIATMVVTLQSIDSSQTIEVDATQPYDTSDLSIWSFVIESEDLLPGTYGMKVQLTENQTVDDQDEVIGGTSLNCFISAVLIVHSLSPEY
jgi:hypothetical protein